MEFPPAGQCHTIGVEVCTDLSSKEPHRQVGMDRMVTSGSLGGEMVSILAQNARDVGSIPTLGAIFSHFRHPPPFMTLVALTMIKLYAVLQDSFYAFALCSRCVRFALTSSISINFGLPWRLWCICIYYLIYCCCGELFKCFCMPDFSRNEIILLHFHLLCRVCSDNHGRLEASRQYYIMSGLR